MKTLDILATAAGLTVGYFIFGNKSAIGVSKQYVVKQWWGNSNDSSNATYKTFPSKKAALDYIKTERRYHQMNNTQFWGASNFYELLESAKVKS